MRHVDRLQYLERKRCFLLAPVTESVRIRLLVRPQPEATVRNSLHATDKQFLLVSAHCILERSGTRSMVSSEMMRTVLAINETHSTAFYPRKWNFARPYFSEDAFDEFILESLNLLLGVNQFVWSRLRRMSSKGRTGYCPLTDGRLV